MSIAMPGARDAPKEWEEFVKRHDEVGTRRCRLAVLWEKVPLVAWRDLEGEAAMCW
jgi:hypothetical protein